MAKYRAARTKKAEAAPQMRAGVPCLIVLIGTMILVAVVMIWAMTHAS